MDIKNRVFISFLFIAMLSGCIGGGTHGYIKAYQYNIRKNELQNAVHKIILNSPSIQQDSIKGYYNDDTSYVSINIFYRRKAFRYIFRYYGGEKYWDTSKTSEIFIAYAHDGNGNGGSSGNGGVKWYDFKLKKRLTDPFEKEFVSKIDSVVGMKHTEE